MKYFCFLFFLGAGLHVYPGDINKQNITIVRDQWGVPHIFSKTDAEAAYGLAWAHSEDAFEWIQQNLLVGKGRLGEVKGTKGVLLDFALRFFGIDTLVEARYEKDISPAFREIFESYIQGINDYAAAHPDEVLLKSALPFTAKDAIKSFVTMTTLMAGAGLDIKAIKDNIASEVFAPNETGSNAMAISPTRTEDGKAWLLINSHQPIEGPMAWYEAHIQTEEGWNMLGGLFPGACTFFVGTNENLGWAHTTNYHNFGDVFELKLSDDKKQYFIDGHWKDFSYKTIRLKVKLGFIKLPVKKKIPLSDFGPVFKTKHGWYALRYPGAMDIRSAEQWYHMNKAKNLEEFEQAVKMEAIPLFNIIYADRAGNIFLISEGKSPLRDSSLDWKRPIAAVNSKYIWSAGQMLPYEKKIKYLNPSCGYLYNCNGTPLHATCKEENRNDYYIGLQLFDYNRNERFGNLLGAIPGKITWDDFKRIKYDESYDSNGSYMRNFRIMYTLDEKKYPAIADAIQKLHAWDLKGNLENKNATLAMLVNKKLAEQTNMPYAFLMIKKNPLTETEITAAVKEARKYLLKRFGTLDVPLGDLQKLSRGNTVLPVSGLSEVPRACDTKYDKKKKIYRMKSGDGYFQMVKFSRDSIELQTISPYGASAHPDSPHYTDQMAMFVHKQTKTMTLDKEEIFKHASRIYHPGL